MKIKLLAGLAGLTLIAAACSDDGADESSATTESATESTTGSTTDDTSSTVPDSVTTVPVTTAPATTAPAATVPETMTSPTTVPDEEDVPSAIVSLSPTATEMLFAIDAGDQVLAVDDFSNYPPEAADKMVGISGFTPNVEAIAGLEPDLVVTDGTNPDFLGQLDSLGIAHWEGPAAVTFDDVYTQIEQLGAATGHPGEAAELVAQMQADIAEVKAALPDPAVPLTYYHELDPELYTATSNTFIGTIYSLVGLENVADTAADDTDYPQLNAEFLVEVNPDLIFLADTVCCGESIETVAARPGWDAIAAVQNGAVFEMDDDIASRWGPRIVDYLAAVAESVADVQSGS
jgi:iron complex transport system substrate-binding protein